MADKGEGRQVVRIVAPFGRDAESIAGVLAAAGLVTLICPHLDALSEALDDDTGLVVVTQEAVARGGDALLPALQRQLAWS